MSYQKEIRLIQKYLQNQISKKDLEYLKEWLAEDKPEHKAIFVEELRVWNSTSQHNMVKVDSEKAFLRFKKRIYGVHNVNSKRSVVLKRISNVLKYAAVIVLVVGASVYFINSNEEIVEEVPVDIENQIVLTLQDGSTKILNKEDNKIVRDKEGNIISRPVKNGLSYFLNSKTKNSKENQELAYNQIVVPSGKVFELTLSDGTHVWLNAGTKFKYPQYFVSSVDTRAVELEGEAFFDVTENKEKPFIVKTSDINVKVLGTKFNVSAYKEDEQVKTVLVEGSVNVLDSKNSDNNQVIAPNQLISFDKKTSNLNTSDVNVDSYISWIYNKLLFVNEPFENIAKKIERSYGVKIYNGNKNLDSTRFYGEFDIENVEDVFKTFATSVPFEYHIEKNIITIQ